MSEKQANFYSPLRDNLYEQYSLCTKSVPVQVTGRIDASKLLDSKRHSSISAYMLAAISRTLKNHPALNASMMRKRFRLKSFRSSIVRFDEVAASVSIDKSFGTERYPFTYVFRNSDKLDVKDFHKKLQYLSKASVEEIQEWEGYFKFLKLPKPARKLFLNEMTKRQELLISKIGTFNFTNLGKWKGLEYVYANSPRLVIGVGSVNKNEIPISYSFNHVICDGAQVAEFHQDLSQMISDNKFD